VQFRRAREMGPKRSIPNYIYAIARLSAGVDILEIGQRVFYRDSCLARCCQDPSCFKLGPENAGAHRHKEVELCRVDVSAKGTWQ
jgi:hypothetical protein